MPGNVDMFSIGLASLRPVFSRTPPAVTQPFPTSKSPRLIAGKKIKSVPSCIGFCHRQGYRTAVSRWMYLSMTRRLYVSVFVRVSLVCVCHMPRRHWRLFSCKTWCRKTRFLCCRWSETYQIACTYNYLAVSLTVIAKSSFFRTQKGRQRSAKTEGDESRR